MTDLLKKHVEKSLEHTNRPWHPFKLGGTWLIRLYPYRAAERFSEMYSLDELQAKRDEAFPHAFTWVLYNTAMKIKAGA